MKENANLGAKLKQKEALIKSLKDQSNENYEDDEDISVLEEVVSIRHNTSGHKCTLCDTLFSTNEELERNMRDKHTKAECPFCSVTFPNNNKIKSHINNCKQN